MLWARICYSLQPSSSMYSKYLELLEELATVGTSPFLLLYLELEIANEVPTSKISSSLFFVNQTFLLAHQYLVLSLTKLVETQVKPMTPKWRKFKSSLKGYQRQSSPSSYHSKTLHIASSSPQQQIDRILSNENQNQT